MTGPADPAFSPRIWQVGALCRAVADFLDARLNPVAVRGEVSGCSRPSSGHLYFSLKDPQGQLRCAMFRRAAGLLDFVPRDGDLVEVQGRLTVYEPRGDLQLVVESLRRAGQGAWYERFAQLKARLEAEGLFDADRKRPLPAMPRAIGLVTSTGAAALHDVATALRRRVPHIPVVLAPAPVQGPQAAGELVRALEALYVEAAAGRIDVILLVRGGGSIEDLWSFNEEALARAVVRSPVPLVCGVGHETDFTIADFCADLRAPTPTAAAELVTRPRADWLQDLQGTDERLRAAVMRRLDTAAQRLDQASGRLGRPSSRLAQQQRALGQLGDRLRHAVRLRLERARSELAARDSRHAAALPRELQRQHERLHRADLRLQLLDPRLVLQRGYALLTDEDGHVVCRAAQTRTGQVLRATLSEGEVDLAVVQPRLL
ncbi:exodeoxyribonuclease VII large subunit [Ramlibacter tataouinensis]|uniref:exodeoxyribonuclease VII large subunit n=1 Tax=Ramlibacter tataouinensis TaxID=94132 RepID=UPI0022F3DE8E|nr:exodeoxyribonuclease VII large subunit [Ramlibacter tataouinensis]WBY02117.1 exodeoxyribonuclease VII large subunit [Ramlibacter tataouinensis]